MATITTGHSNRISGIAADAEAEAPPAQVSARIPAAIKDITTHTAKESSRYAINGVLVERVKAGDGYRLTLAATDGHRLAALDVRPHDAHEGEAEFSVIVPADVLKLLKVKPADDGIMLHRDDAGRWELRHDGQILPFEPNDGNFPPYRDVIPQYDYADTANQLIGINPKYMADAGTLGAKFARRCESWADGKTPLAWQHAEPGKPAKLTAHAGDHHLTIVIMPITLSAAYTPRMDQSDQ